RDLDRVRGDAGRCRTAAAALLADVLQGSEVRARGRCRTGARRRRGTSAAGLAVAAAARCEHQSEDDADRKCRAYRSFVHLAIPPDTEMSSPVTNDDASLAR